LLAVRQLITECPLTRTVSISVALATVLAGNVALDNGAPRAMTRRYGIYLGGNQDNVVVGNSVRAIKMGGIYATDPSNTIT
jgi:parallel beta-helix repeat protein